MIKLELAGITITYRNAAELNSKTRLALEQLRGQRARLEEKAAREAKEIRKRERALERFLEGPTRNRNVAANDTFNDKEVAHV